MSSWASTKLTNKWKRIRYLSKSLSNDSDMEFCLPASASTLTESQRALLDLRVQNIDGLSSSEVATQAIEWLNEFLLARDKSENIKGQQRRTMKVGTESAIMAICSLVERADIREGD